MADPKTDGVERLWPTVMLRRTLPGAEIANQALAEFILELEAGNTQLTTDYRNDNLLVADHPAVYGCATASTAR